MSYPLFRRLALSVALAALVGLAAASPAFAALGTPLIAESQANQLGLTRAWFSQVLLDGGRGRVTDAVVDGGQLFVQTDSAMLQAFDAETGKTLWSRVLGSPNSLSLRAGVGRDYIAFINGSTLYVLNRHDGRLLHEHKLRGAPGAGAAVTKHRIYLPLTDGTLVSYRTSPLHSPLDAVKTDTAKDTPREPQSRSAHTAAASASPASRAQPAADTHADEAYPRPRVELTDEPPLFSSSAGKAVVAPLAIAERANEDLIVWATDRGYLNFAVLDPVGGKEMAVRYRLKTMAPIDVPAVHLPPENEGEPGLVLAGCSDGDVYAIDDRHGSMVWRFATADRVADPIACIDKRLFVPTAHAGMYCLDARTGNVLWHAPNVTRLLAASKERAYVGDRAGRLEILNLANGARLAELGPFDFTNSVINVDTDRIYLVSDTGAIQCLHEVGLETPLTHQVEHEPAEAKPEDAAAAAGGHAHATPHAGTASSTPHTGAASGAPHASGAAGGAAHAAAGGGAAHPATPPPARAAHPPLRGAAARRAAARAAAGGAAAGDNGAAPGGDQ